MTPMTRREQLEQWVEKKKMEKSSVMKEQENLSVSSPPTPLVNDFHSIR